MGDDAKQAGLPEIAATDQMKAIVPQTMDEVARFAKMVLGSGMAPRDKTNPQQIAIAVMQGMEVGLTPLQAINDIAVINNRPTIWGDALIALVRRHGHQVQETIEGDGDKAVAKCVVMRADTGEKIERTFSVDDAKKANLWGKSGPWTSYPKRMLQMRARGWAIRDGCADSMKGLRVAEEERDTRPMRDVTPETSAGSARAMELLKKKTPPEAHPPKEEEPPVSEDPPADVEDAEIVDPSVDPESEFFKEGVKAYEDFGPSAMCPESYAEGSAEQMNWQAGFHQEFEKDQGE